MRFVFTSDAEEFARRAGPFIEPRLECNVMAGVLRNVLDGLYAGGESLFAYGVADADVSFAAMRTPPWAMLTSELDPGAARELIGRWLEMDPELPGVNSVPAAARAIAAAWKAHAGGETHCRMRQAIHTLTEVQDPPRPATGRLREPEEHERDLLVRWMAEFAREAGMPGADQAQAVVRVRLARRNLLVWDDGAAVSMVGLAGPVAGVTRIGPVYTPPERRRHGYASSAVAELSRLSLARGAHTCMLYTDLANPTSNKIYFDVGYRRFADWEEHAFERAGPAGAHTG